MSSLVPRESVMVSGLYPARQINLPAEPRFIGKRKVHDEQIVGYSDTYFGARRRELVSAIAHSRNALRPHHDLGADSCRNPRLSTAARDVVEIHRLPCGYKDSLRRVGKTG